MTEISEQRRDLETMMLGDALAVAAIEVLVGKEHDLAQVTTAVLRMACEVLLSVLDQLPKGDRQGYLESLVTLFGEALIASVVSKYETKEPVTLQ